jgi:hypothetical protein
MSKIAVSPNEHFSGTVAFSEPLTLPQVLGLERAIVAAQTAEIRSERDLALLPGILGCVEKWELANLPKTVTLETFPGSPRVASRALVEWLFAEVLEIYNGEKIIPLA